MKILIIIDMQNDFVTGPLGSETAKSLVGGIKDILNDFKDKGFPVIFTRDTHSRNYLKTMEGRNLPVEHCIKDTEGWDIISDLNTEGCSIINKKTFGAKKLPNLVVEKLKEWINENKAQDGLSNLDEIVIVGLCTDICVISNAIILKSAFPEVLITVREGLCAGVTKESHNNALEAMKMCQINIE